MERQQQQPRRSNRTPQPRSFLVNDPSFGTGSRSGERVSAFGHGEDNMLRGLAQHHDATVAAKQQQAQQLWDGLGMTCKEVEVGHPDGVGKLFYGGGLSGDDCALAAELAAQLFPDPDTPEGRAEWEAKSFKHIYFPAMRYNQLGYKVLMIARRWWRDSGWDEAGFRVVRAFIVGSVGNSEPLHQDLKTGKNAFVKGGFRLIMNLTPGRQLRLISKQADGSQQVLHELDAGAVGMNGPMAGTGGKGTAHHAREGDGFSLVLDIYQSLGVGGWVFAGRRASTLAVFKFFHMVPEPAVLHAIGHREQTGKLSLLAAALERATTAKAELDDARERAELPCHCCTCGSLNNGHPHPTTWSYIAVEVVEVGDAFGEEPAAAAAAAGHGAATAAAAAGASSAMQHEGVVFGGEAGSGSEDGTGAMAAAAAAAPATPAAPAATVAAGGRSGRVMRWQRRCGPCVAMYHAPDPGPEVEAWLEDPSMRPSAIKEVCPDGCAGCVRSDPPRNTRRKDGKPKKRKGSKLTITKGGPRKYKNGSRSGKGRGSGQGTAG